MTDATPPFPEAALRGLLAAAVAAWAREPSPGDAQSAEGAPRRLYVDGFAGAELQFGTGVLRGPAEPTRAQAAVRAIDEACAGHAPCPTALFVEEDPAHLQRIYGELEDAIGGERLRATRDFGSLAAGEASLVEAPFASVAGEVARFAAAGRAFVWLAPATARALPWTAVEPLIAIPGATLLIRFPHADFEKQSRHGGSLADLPGFARRIVEGCSSLLADGKHAWLSAWRTDAKNGDAAAIPGVLERFRALLAGAAGERMVRPVELQSAGGARTWCFLVTADAAIALAIAGDSAVGDAAVQIGGGRVGEPAVQVDSSAADEAMTQESASPMPKPAVTRGRTKGRRAAGRSAPAPVVEIEEDAVAAAAAPVVEATHREVEPAEPPPVPIDEPPAELVVPEPGAEPPPEPVDVGKPVAAPVALPDREQPVAEVLDLFADAPVQPAAPARPEVALAAEVEARFGSRTATWGDVAASFAAGGVAVDALKVALRHLRRGGRASYTALRVEADEIVFPPEPVAPAKANRRPKITEDDGLFGSGE
ncbi:hypothetical protein SAMN05216486_12017 [bacterium JGI 053]|nr:hypothetical protein SAMN05216486_12017 [bacterium JGI 053]